MITGPEHQSDMNTKGDTEKAQVRKRKPSLDWNKWDAIFFVIIIPFIILATLIILAPSGGISYLSGRFDFRLDFFVCILFYPTVMIIILVPFVVIGGSIVAIGALRLLFDRNRYTTKKKLIRTTQIGISILLITLYFLALFIPIQPYSPGYKPFTYGFRERMRSKADVEDIRDWLRTLSKEDCTGRHIDILPDFFFFKSKWPDSIEWPKSLKVFNPHYVNLDLDENGKPKVRLTWGGPFAHWGVVIGMEDMEIPESDFSRYGEYRLPLQPGAYVWHELQ